MRGMAEETILLVEKPGTRAPVFAAALESKGYALVVVATGAEALERAEAVGPALVILNAASIGSSGVRICRSLRQALSVPIIHILPEGSESNAVHDPSCDVLLRLPFTIRKLANRVRQLLPADSRDTLRVGPIEFARTVSVVRAHGRETRLTPKAASLLEVFLHHPDETLDRGYLMRRVWDTNYTGDTRTLDVHVRWVRQAIEADPASPCHIRTVRGKGYRFEPEKLP